MAEYTGLRRVPTGEATIPGVTGESTSGFRSELDERYSFYDDPYKAWDAKRRYLKRKVTSLKPSATDDEMSNVYKAYGLGDETTPGDHSRESGVMGDISRIGSLTANTFGQLYDAAGMKFDDLTGNTEGVMENQEQIDVGARDNALIQQFYDRSSEEKNVITQFVFDLAASAPTMGAMMGVGIGAGALATGVVAGIPMIATWLAAGLAYAGVNALFEMGFNYLDIVTDPMVREKMEDAVGHELNTRDLDDIKVRVQDILMD